MQLWLQRALRYAENLRPRLWLHRQQLRRWLPVLRERVPDTTIAAADPPTDHPTDQAADQAAHKSADVAGSDRRANGS